MSLNQSFAMDKNKVKRYGKVFGSIDFKLKQNISQELIKRQKPDLVIGSFYIAGKEIPVTLAELDRISETCEIAKSVFRKNYIMGSYR